MFFCSSAFKRQSSQILLAFLKTATEESCTTSSQSLLAFVETATEEPCTTSSQSLLVFLKTATEESCTTNRQILQENTANKPNAEFQTFTSSSLIHEEAGRENFCVQQPLAEREGLNRSSHTEDSHAHQMHTHYIFTICRSCGRTLLKKSARTGCSNLSCLLAQHPQHQSLNG